MVVVANDVVDFGWWKPAGEYGVRLSWDRSTGVLFFFDARPGPGGGGEPLAVVTEDTARRIGNIWHVMGGPEYVRRAVVR